MLGIYFLGFFPYDYFTLLLVLITTAFNATIECLIVRVVQTFLL